MVFGYLEIYHQRRLSWRTFLGARVQIFQSSIIIINYGIIINVSYNYIL